MANFVLYPGTAFSKNLETRRVEWEQKFVNNTRGRLKSIEHMHSWGWYGRPCACDEPSCEGFSIHHAHEEALMDDGLIRDGHAPMPILGFGGADRNP